MHEPHDRDLAGDVSPEIVGLAVLLVLLLSTIWAFASPPPERDAQAYAPDETYPVPAR